MAKKLTATQKAQKNSQYSSFWFDDEDYSYGSGRYGRSYVTSFKDDDDASDEYKRTIERGTKMTDLLKLGAFMRSCGNFVRILTSRDDITVKYSEGDDSYTDGKTVTLSSKVEGNFDSTVGLALHEASHIVKTDFTLLKKLFEDVKYRRTFITKEMIDKVVTLNPKIVYWDYKKVFGKTPVETDIANLSAVQIRADLFLLTQFKDIVNWIEDRRIDTWVYSTAPGYRGYYEALYNRYFYSDDVSKQLKENNSFNTETLDSYMYRIINMINPDADMTVLKGLQSIKETINVPKIARYNSTTEVFQCSSEVLRIIMDNITELDYKTSQMKKFGKGDPSNDGVSIDIDSLTEKECKEMFGIGKAALKRLMKKMQEQRDFVSGDIDKKALSKADSKDMSTLQSGGVTMEQAGGDEFNGNTVKVMVIEKLSDGIVENEDFRNAFNTGGRSWRSSGNDGAIKQGFILGKLLGSRLQIRNEEKSLKFTRQENGKIDRRLVASLGYDVENIFSKVETNRFNKASIHISVDASGSMSGARFSNAIKTCVAIAVACKMTSNLECAISFRTTTSSLPLVYIAYDSKKNPLSHIRKYFPMFAAHGSTPESLCFEAISKLFPKVARDEQFYFINMSDGEPAFSVRTGGTEGENFYYSGDSAYRHCKRMMDKMSRNGATIISYLISDGGASLDVLKRMYGNKNAFNINTDSIEQIARTLNKKFLEASQKSTTSEGSI